MIPLPLRNLRFPLRKSDIHGTLTIPQERDTSPSPDLTSSQI